MEKNFPHHGGGKFFKGGKVTGLADFVADVGSWTGLGRFFFRGQRELDEGEQKK
jgi:hypothetical protein